jgi:hypothetical protein
VSDELRATAERLIKFVAMYRLHPQSHKGLEDAQSVARAYLAEHPADDAEPLTEEWLRAAGFETRDGRLCLGARLQFTHCNGWNAWWGIDGLAYASSRLVNGLNTRGHVRRLCQCLGIALKESR